MKLEEMTLDLELQVDVKGAMAEVFKGVLHQLGEGNTQRDGLPLDMKLEEWAGGRWYRDRGEGIQHLWGHVQVIKPSSLIELSGPMFMSYPAINHIEIKLTENEGSTRINFRHRAIGMIEQAHREGVVQGWQKFLDSVKDGFAG